MFLQEEKSLRPYNTLYVSYLSWFDLQFITRFPDNISKIEYEYANQSIINEKYE